MTDCCSPKGYRTMFSPRSARSEAKRYRRSGLDPLSRRVARVVREFGVTGRTILEVGGGIGAIEIDLVTAGAAGAVNVELTPTYEESAMELLHEAGLTDRVERRIGDFAETSAEIPMADIVILNRVLCCYPDMPRLAAAAAQHARTLLVLTFPTGRWWIRSGLALANLGFRLFRVEFHIFTHAPARIVAEAERHGLRARISRRGLVWQMVALERIGDPATS